MEYSTGNAVKDEGAPESMLARMLTPAHATPEDTHMPLTLEQLHSALTGRSPHEPHAHASLLLGQLRGALATREVRVRAPLPPDPPPGWAGTNPLRLADHPLNTILDFEAIKRKKEALRKEAAELALRDFNQHISAVKSSEAGDSSARQLNNGEITITVASNAEDTANVQNVNNQNHEIPHSPLDALEITEVKTEQSMLMLQLLSQSNGYEVEDARAAPARPRPRPRAASVVPDISITPRAAAAELVAPRAASAPASIGLPQTSRAGTAFAPAVVGRLRTSPLTTTAAAVPTITAAVTVAAPTAAAVTAQADAGVDGNVESPYSDNQLLVEVQNPDRRKRRSTKAPRLMSASGSYEEWEHIPGGAGGGGGGARADYDADFTPPPSKGLKRKTPGHLHRSPEQLAPPPPARRHQHGVRKTQLRGVKRKLQSFLQKVHGKTVNDEEMEALLVGPTYDKEALDEADLFREFVQIAVTKVFEPLPCSRLLRAALRTRRAAPAAFFQHLTKTAEVAFVSVEHAACRPGDSPFRRHSFRGALSSAEEPAGAVRALLEHAGRMRTARAALAHAAQRLQRQLQVVRELMSPAAAGEAGPPLARLPAGEAGPPRAGLAARLPARTMQDFQQLNADLKASPALRDELMVVYRAAVAAARSPGAGVQAALALTLAPPADRRFSSSGRRYRGVSKPSYSATVPYACLRDAISEKFSFSDSENFRKFKKYLSLWLNGLRAEAAP